MRAGRQFHRRSDRNDDRKNRRSRRPCHICHDNALCGRGSPVEIHGQFIVIMGLDLGPFGIIVVLVQYEMRVHQPLGVMMIGIFRMHVCKRGL